MPPDILGDHGDGRQQALGLQHCANQPSSMGLLQRASRFFYMPQMPSSSTNVTLFNRASHFEVHGHAHLVNAYNLNVMNTYGENHDLLDIMKPSVSFGARHDSYADDPEHRCHPETRQYVLKRLQDWIDDITSTERIFWLHGSAGAGKSAIAHTIADSNDLNKVAASFFFCRSDTDRNDGNRLFITLSWQLALSIPAMQSHIIQSLNRDPGLLWRSVETQFKELIARPFQAIMQNATSQAQSASLVVIIDGIDECSDQNLQRRILGIIGNAASNADIPLRFLISSRLEAHIKRVFDQFKCPILSIDLRLEKLEELVSFDAIHNSRSQSLARRRKSSSRKHTLKRLQGWVDNPRSVERISWLHGPASSGKSTVAQAVADLNEREKVVATFFFHKSDATRNDGTRLFPTLCWQLASSISTYKDYIIQYLAQCISFPSQDIEDQFELLIARPFEAPKEVGSQEQPLDYVVVIDGVDECTCMRIQWKFLEAIGNAVRTRRVPLRFLVASRSKNHIQEAINRFQCPVLNVDLGIVPSGTGTSAKPYYNLRIAPAKDPYVGLFYEPAITLTFPATHDFSFAGMTISFPPSRLDFEDGAQDNTHINIKKYLKAEFSRIATMQGFAKPWPGRRVIQDLVHRSSGHFIYANTIVKLIGEGRSNAETLLNRIRELQPRTETSFAHLDELYFQILKWQPDQVFLKNILTLLIVRTSILEDYEDLWIDDTVLMDVWEDELQTKLQGMRSLLDLEPYVKVHHQSFPDFLQDASRSGQYHISKEEGSRQFLRLITGSLVRYVDNVFNQPWHVEIDHFTFQFSQVVKEYPRRIELPVAEWQEVLHPLLKLGRRIFISSTKSTPIRIIRHLLLHLAFLRGTSSIQSTEPVADEAEEFEEYIDGATVIDDSLHSCLSPLLAHLRNPMSQSGSDDPEIMAQMYTVLYFDCAEIVARIQFISDAQNLVDVIIDVLNKKQFLNQCGPDAERKAILLVLEIYARIPVLPRSLFLEGSAHSGFEQWICRSSEIEILCQSALIGKLLDSKYIVPVSRVCEEKGTFTFVSGSVYAKSMSLSRWRRSANPSLQAVMQVMFEVAKAFQYLHSMGAILHYSIDSADIFLDSNLSPKIRFFGSFLLYLVKTPSICLEERSKVLMTREANVFNFGCLLYQMVSNVKIPLEDRVKFKKNTIVKHPTKADIPYHVWKLIQLCCREDPKRRPTMDEVVISMRRWCLDLPPLPDPQDVDKIGPKPTTALLNKRKNKTLHPFSSG